MADVKDILGVQPKAVGGGSGSKGKPADEKPVRPKWMSREAFALLDDSHPIMPSAFKQTTGMTPKSHAHTRHSLNLTLVIRAPSELLLM
jgi:hypothetical protein